MTAQRDTGKAALPALPNFNPSDSRSMALWAQRVAERLEVREGARGNPFERAVTLRELNEATKGLLSLSDKREPGPGEILIELGGGLTASARIDQFVDALRNSRLYRDLAKRIDDPSRFDHLASEIRTVLLRSIADEAAIRGADIRRTETLIQDANRSLAMAVSEITAALGANSAGIRELQATYVNQQRATATKVTQLEVSLGNFYQDGRPGRAGLEQQMLTQASHTQGLLAQYTLKVQAGGALAGFGLAAQEVNGVPSSAFIIRADRFAIVAPTYTGGLTATPDSSTVPFGVDASGIFMNTNVYIRGNMRVDTGGRVLSDGMRGSLNLSATGSAWSDVAARQAVWAALGRAGSAWDNNHLVIGDTVTMRSAGTPPSFIETRHWMGWGWTNPGVVINGNLLVDGSLAAHKIDTRGLDIRDASGNVVFSAGTSLNASRVAGLGSLATQNAVAAGQVTGLGALATRNDARIGAEVRFPDGSTMGTADFVNRLSRITADNIGTFMNSAAIGSAFIGNAAIQSAHIGDASVGTLKIAGNAVTVPVVDQRFDTVSGSGHAVHVARVVVTLQQPGMVFAIFVANQTYGSGLRVSHTALHMPSGQVITVGGAAVTTNICVAAAEFLPAGTHTFIVNWNGQDGAVRIDARTLFVMGAMR